MSNPEDSDKKDTKPDRVPFWIMGAIVLVVIAIVIYGP